MIRKEFECRRNGILSLELAHRAADFADEARMLKLAQDWLDLANLIHRLVRPTCPKDRGASFGQSHVWTPRLASYFFVPQGNQSRSRAFRVIERSGVASRGGRVAYV